MSFQRVKHADPIISFFTAECSPVSLKQEREVKYEIKAQCQIDGTWHEFSTERLTQRFGVKKPSCKSKVKTNEDPALFPPLILGHPFVKMEREKICSVCRDKDCSMGDAVFRGSSKSM